MAKINKDFKSQRALDAVALIAIVFVVAVFAKTTIAIIDAFQTEVYTNVIAGISNL